MQRGFTLIELLVLLAIISISVKVIHTTYQTHINSKVIVSEKSVQ